MATLTNVTKLFRVVQIESESDEKGMRIAVILSKDNEAFAIETDSKIERGDIFKGTVTTIKETGVQMYEWEIGFPSVIQITSPPKDVWEMIWT